MIRDSAFTAELDAVFRSDLMVAKASSAEEMRRAALASLESLVPGARTEVEVTPDPDHPDCFRVHATIG
jgi:hypothetical protein